MDCPHINRLFLNITRTPHLSNFAINYTIEKEKRIENNPNALKIKLEITMLENKFNLRRAFCVCCAKS